MNPYPLTKPDGTLLGHACGRCNHITTISRVQRMYDEDTHDVVSAEERLSSEDFAEKCCRCDKCGVPKEKSAWQYCEACYWWSSFKHVWYRVGMAASLGVTNTVVWAVVQEELDYGKHMNELLAFANREPFVEEKLGPEVLAALASD